MRGRRATPLLALLVGAATAAAAQDAVSLRLQPRVGLETVYHTELTTWLQLPRTAPGDGNTPVATLVWDMHRVVEASDSTALTLLDVIDSSRLDLPAVRGNSYAGTAGDLLRGLRVRTRISWSSGEVETTVLEAPALPADLPILLRGVVSLAVASSHLSTVTAPSRIVAPGDTWTDSMRYEVPAPSGPASSVLSGGAVATVTSRLARFERRGSRRIAVLNATAAINAAIETGMPAVVRLDGSGRIDLDLTTGQLAGSNLDMSGMMTTPFGTVPTRLRLIRRAR